MVAATTPAWPQTTVIIRAQGPHLSGVKRGVPVVERATVDGGGGRGGVGGDSRSGLAGGEGACGGRNVDNGDDASTPASPVEAATVVGIASLIKSCYRCDAGTTHHVVGGMEGGGCGGYADYGSSDGRMGGPSPGVVGGPFDERASDESRAWMAAAGARSLAPEYAKERTM